MEIQRLLLIGVNLEDIVERKALSTKMLEEYHVHLVHITISLAEVSLKYVKHAQVDGYATQMN